MPALVGPVDAQTALALAAQGMGVCRICKRVGPLNGALTAWWAGVPLILVCPECFEVGRAVVLERMPEATLLPIKHCYGAWDWVLYAASLARLTAVLGVSRRPLVAHLIVASRGDRVRGVLPILLCRLFRVPLCAHYHTNRANMSWKACHG